MVSVKFGRHPLGQICPRKLRSVAMVPAIGKPLLRSYSQSRPSGPGKTKPRHHASALPCGSPASLSKISLSITRLHVMVQCHAGTGTAEERLCMGWVILNE